MLIFCCWAPKSNGPTVVQTCTALTMCKFQLIYDILTKALMTYSDLQLQTWMWNLYTSSPTSSALIKCLQQNEWIHWYNNSFFILPQINVIQLLDRVITENWIKTSISIINYNVFIVMEILTIFISRGWEGRKGCWGLHRDPTKVWGNGTFLTI